MSSSSEPPRDGRWAASKLAERLLQDEELREFYRDAINELDREAFHTKHFKILEEYLHGLRDKAQDHVYNRILRVLSTSPQPLLLSRSIERLSTVPAGGPTGKENSPSASLGHHLTPLGELSGQNIQPGTVTGSSKAAEGSTVFQAMTITSSSGVEWGLQGELPEGVDDEVPRLSQGDSRTFMEMLDGSFFESGASFKLLRKQVRYLPFGESRQRRRTHMLKLGEFLRNHFDEAAMGGDEWIGDLKKLGHSHEEISRLLCESKFDSPWIYYDETDSMTETWTETWPSVHEHRPSCPDKLLAGAPGTTAELPWKDDKEEAGEDEASEISKSPGEPSLELSEGKNHVIEHFCGLGGLSPTSMDEWGAEIHFEKENTKALVRNRCWIPLQLLDRCVCRLLSAIGHAQDAGLCCCSFTLLTRSRPVHDADSEIRLVSLTFSEIITSLRILKKPTSTSPNSRPSEESLTPLLRRIFPDARLSEGFVGHSYADLLQATFLAVQLLSVGLLSYKQAHVGAIRPFFLDTPIDEIYLLGLHNEGYSSHFASVKAQLVELSCLSELTKGPVLVFSPSWAEGGQWSPQPGQGFSVRGTPEAILDTWGPGGLVSRKDSSGSYIAMQIGTGYIYASDTPSTPTMYHFGPELKLSDDSPVLSPGVDIVVGNPVQENGTCQNIEENCWTYASRNHHLEDIRAHDPFWVPHQRQMGLQGGNYLIFQFVSIQEKKPGKTVKDSVLHYVEPEMHTLQGNLVDSLDHHHGLRVSYCTGIAQRVPLRRVVADLLPRAARCLTAGSKWELWLSLSGTHEAIQKFRNINIPLGEWLLNLPDNLRGLIHELLGLVFGALRHTGVDITGKYFNILWARGGNLGSGLKIPINGDNRWVTMLADTKHTATFAYITHTCLECSPITCRGHDPSWGNEIRLLDTAVYERASESTTLLEPEQPESTALLEPEQVYYFAVGATTVWFKARPAAKSVHPTELVCLSYPASIPQKIIARLMVWEWEGRKKQMLAEDHMTAGASIRVKIRPPD